jgi:hypothetical protein
MNTNSYQFSSMNRAYPELIDVVKMYGAQHFPGGRETLDVRPFCFQLEDPRLSLYSHGDRKLNYRFFIIELLGYIAGLDARWYMDLLCDVAKQFERYKMPDGRLSGSYGKRLDSSWNRVLNLLKEDSETRQAVMSIWDSNEECELNIFCTLNFQFINTGSRSKPKLSMFTNMRSNDLNWGLPYDVASFCFIQCMMAEALGWNLGFYHHHAGSFHIYTDALPKNDGPEVFCPLTEFPCIFGEEVNINSFRKDCAWYLESIYHHIFLGPDEANYLNFEHQMGHYITFFEWCDSLIKFQWKDLC